jgi:hypothetical protein
MRIPLLDHGYIELIETWGSDERIIESARMSTNKGFKQWGTPEQPGDEKLLAFLYNNKHMSPFEMAGMTVEVCAPLFVFREWHRHRTQCLAPDTEVHFQSPNKKIYKMKISDVYQKWQPSQRLSRPERQTNPFYKRGLIRNMAIRCLNEGSGEITTTHINDVIKGPPKEMLTVTTDSGKVITASRDHKFFTISQSKSTQTRPLKKQVKGRQLTITLLADKILM